MRTNKPKTPLLALLRAMTDDQRRQFGEDCETDVSYLYSLASCGRKQCKAEKAVKIEHASRLMNKRTNGATPIITVLQLGTMCQCVE